MFLLATISDLIHISPKDFEKPTLRSIRDGINEKYANKIVQNVGLCICLRDILSHSEGLIGYGTGIVNVNVDFRLLVFRPYKGEIIQGEIVRSSDREIRLTLDFFDDIKIPAPVNAFEGTAYRASEKVWVWCPPDLPERQDFYYDEQEMARFRVESEIWHDQSPKKPARNGEVEERKSPYSIIASMQQSGLGPQLWWDEAEETANEEAAS